MGRISFDIHNKQQLVLTQFSHDDRVFVTHEEEDGRHVSKTKTIPNGQFVMLMNLYAYIMDNDIQNDFINPYGKNKET